MNSPLLGRLAAAFLLLTVTPLFAQNLVVNGNFETGTTAGWTQSGNTSNSGVSTNAQDPLTANALNHFGYQAGPVTTGSLLQMIPTTPGAVYDWSFWFALQTNSATNDFRVTLNGQEIWHNSNINPGSANPHTINNPGATPFTATSSFTTFQFDFLANGDAHWFLDDVIFQVRPTAAPENGATVGLLALACVGLVALRKRGCRAT